MVDYTPILNLIFQAGQNLKEHFGNAVISGQKSECAADVVTELDKETENFYEQSFKKLFPDIGFKGEEFGARNLGDRFWLVDPIDGTGLFARGLYGCTSMVALIEEGEITFSAIYDFVTDKMYSAQKGQGTYLNKKPITVSNRRLKDAYLYVESNIQKEENAKAYLKLDKKCIILNSYPAGIHFALTAEGKVEGRICFDPFGKDYDFASGQLLVKEAGGVVANIGTHAFDYQNLNFLAVNNQVYEDLTSGEDPIFPI